MDWVWSVWGWIWPASFDENKFKVDLKTGIIRTNLHKLKLQEQLQRDKGEVLELVRSNKMELARIKVESLIQEHRKLAAYVHYCESLSTRIELLRVTGDTPSEVLSAIHTIAYAAANLNIQELHGLAAQLKAKYGYNIGNNQIESAALWIDKKVIDSLSVAPPSEEVINKYMQEFYGKAESSDVHLPFTKSEATEPQYQPYSTFQQPTASPSPYTPTFQYSPPPVSPPPSAPAYSPPPITTPTHALYPELATPSHPPYSFSPSSSPASSSSYVDPSLLYSSPCTTYASAPFVSPPPENPEFTAHEASRAHIINLAKKRTTPESSPSPKKELDGGIRKKKRAVKIKKRKSNPFQRGASYDVPSIKQEEAHYDSSDEEFMDKYNREANASMSDATKSESEESPLDINARLEALKRNK